MLFKIFLHKIWISSAFLAHLSLIRFPFDTKNLCGYLVGSGVQYIFVFNSMITMECLATFCVGTCFIVFPLANDTKHSLKTINFNAKYKKNHSNIVIQLYQFVRFHAKLIRLCHTLYIEIEIYIISDSPANWRLFVLFRLIHNYLDLLKIIFIIIFIWSIGGICAILLMFNMVRHFWIFIDRSQFWIDFFWQQDAMNSLVMINLISLLVWSFAIIFSVCEFGEGLSGTFGEINYLYDQFAWYLFPNDVQHMLSTLMIFAQRPIELRVFGSVSCERITFKKVRKFTKRNAQLKVIEYGFYVVIFFVHNVDTQWSLFVLHGSSGFWKLKVGPKNT